MGNLPIPTFFSPKEVSEVSNIFYEDLHTDAIRYAKEHDIKPSKYDKTGVYLLLIDVQNTFCIPGYELFVGNSVIQDNIRLCEFIYRNLGSITKIGCTLDTHRTMQIFHKYFWINDDGEHPEVMTQISVQDIERGVWKPNTEHLHIIDNKEWLMDYCLHYVSTLSKQGKYPLTIWPYHAMTASTGQAIVSSVHEACFFHEIARKTPTDYHYKGENPLTENYSVLKPEVMFNRTGQRIAEKNNTLIRTLLTYDKLLIAGQAKSHCVAWTVADLLSEIESKEIGDAKNVYLMEDLTSPVIIPGVVDYTPPADAAFERFAKAGMNIVKSTNYLDFL